MKTFHFYNRFIFVSDYQVSSMSHETLFWYYVNLRMRLTYIEEMEWNDQKDTLSDRELKKWRRQIEKDFNEEYERLEIHARFVSEVIQGKIDAGEWHEPLWLFPERRFSELESKLMLGSDNPHETLRQLIWHLNDDLTDKVKYEAGQFNGMEDLGIRAMEGLNFREMKLAAIQDLNQPGLSNLQKKLLYFYRIAQDWEHLRTLVHRDLWLDNLQKKGPSRR